MTEKKEKSPMSKSNFFESQLNDFDTVTNNTAGEGIPPTLEVEKQKSKKEKQTFTKEQVTELLKKQITACANSIQVSNQIEYNAKRKIMLTKIVEE
jgi:hypothetical protein